MKRAVLAFAVTAFLFAPIAARGGDLEDLKAAEEQLLKAWNQGDVDALVAGYHDQGAGFWPDFAFPMDSAQMDKATRRDGWKEFFARTEFLTIEWINKQYRVIGSTGIVWGHVREMLKPKDGPQRLRFYRTTVVYSKSGGKWLQVCWHSSAIPSGD